MISLMRDGDLQKEPLFMGFFWVVLFLVDFRITARAALAVLI